MTRPAEIPAEHRVTRVLEQYLAECRENGKRPSVLALATRLGMSNTTFRRHFPDHARHISNLRTTPDPESRTGADEPPSPYDRLVARNAKLRRANRSLTQNLHLAAAQIQRLALENARLREALQATTNVIHIDARVPTGRDS